MTQKYPEAPYSCVARQGRGKRSAWQAGRAAREWLLTADDSGAGSNGTKPIG